MGIFDKISKALTIDDNNENKGVLGKAKQMVSNVFKPDEKFEWGMKRVKEYSEKKAKLSSEISNLEYEFNFYDEKAQVKIISEKYGIVEDKDNQISKLKFDIRNYRKEISNLKKDMQIQNSDQNTNSYATKEELRKVNNKINTTKDLISNILKDIDKLEAERLEALENYALQLSYIDGNLELIESIKEKNGLRSPFITYGLEALKYLDNDDIFSAIKNVKKLFEIEQLFNNPKLALLYGQYNYEIKSYDKALEAFAYYSSFYPESADIHKKLYQTHKILDQHEEATLEKTIYEMIS